MISCFSKPFLFQNIHEATFINLKTNVTEIFSFRITI